ncbi:methyltransferase domain-containing protein [Gemmata sp. JC717]|uniref:methyltransferase domain-containing protein n=1 Tax=Gemmata algarum TaxID=2975278 RepID=UPI0021BB1B7D|nr:methyltransferase domain-containing protein [Gemmata algarum]MDY3552746.1 methyltransferase domain-containing protein [Gemmata algarum]
MKRALVCSVLFAAAVVAQDKSVNPGINDPFKNPDVEKYAKTFEGESREVFVNRAAVVQALGLKPGMVVADIGAGTGLYTRLFAKEVGRDGQVFAVDIAPKFLEHVQKTSREAGLRNVTPVLCSSDAVDLPPNSVDVAFVCDTYHHFEFPEKTVLSLHRALKPGGRVAVIDFHRVAGQSSDWTLKHVRAGQEVFEKEITSCGFKKTAEVKGLLKDNYFVIFTKAAKTGEAPAKGAKPVTPVIDGYGAVVPQPGAPEPPAKGSKVVFDVTGVGKDAAQPPPGLVRAATLLNLAGASGLKPSDLEIVVVLHGAATGAALDDGAYKELTGAAHPSADVMKKLKGAGVTFLVCGQALARKGYDPARVRSGASVAASAVTAVVNLQARGFAYVPAPWGA